jgi:hypothetical protein
VLAEAREVDTVFPIDPEGPARVPGHRSPRPEGLYDTECLKSDRRLGGAIR